MKPMFSSLLLRKFAAESVCKSFYIGVFAQSIVFSAQDKCFMIPRFDRMFFDICVIRKIQRFYIVLHFHSFPELFFRNAAVFHKITDYSFHVCYRGKKPRAFDFLICKCKQFKISSHAAAENGYSLILICRKRVHCFQLPNAFVGHNELCFIYSFPVLRQVKAENLIALCGRFFREYPNAVIDF